MKTTIVKWLACAAALVLCAVSAASLLTYTRPMEDAVYDFSLGWTGEAMPDDWVYDQKGWTVFTQEGETVTELTPDGCGGFTGISEMGQTFYFSRVLTEELDGPTLRLGAANQNMAVFLDGNLLYTDCPELDNRIGYMTLPMLEWDRTDTLTVSLPVDYEGKTLTVAQSTSPEGGERQEPTSVVWPCSVTFYCGYSYESALIAESFRTAIPAAFAFAAGMVLLAVFVRQVFYEKADIGLFCAAMASVFWLTAQMNHTSFALSYFGIRPIDLVSLCYELSFIVLLVFLASRMTEKRRIFLLVLIALVTAFTLADMGMQIAGSLTRRFVSVQAAVELAALLGAVVCSFWEWLRNGRWFFRCLCPLLAAGAVLLAAAVCMQPVLRKDILTQIEIMAFGYIFWLLLQPVTAAVLAAAVAEAVRGEISRRTEARLLLARQDMAQASYETMQRQHEQVMMIRHDMVKHFRFLRQMSEGPAADYLDELIGQNEKIRPVVQSGNEMMDTILNGRLSPAADAGVKIEIIRMSVPQKLPLSDAALCSLTMNVLDNAVAAACAPGVEHPYIQLDLHVKSGFFVFSCKNSAARDRVQKTEQKGGIPEHGLGLKIIRQTVRRCGGMLETTPGSDFYQVVLALPLI